MISRACSTQAADFYPRPPRGGRPDDAPPPRRAGSFLSTPSARRATIPGRFRSRRIQISIHALREEGDRDVRGVADLQQISIHALREEGDRSRKCSRKPASRFLSTPSARRATASTAVCASTEEFLSTPSARRATETIFTARSTPRISIHALREEGDGWYTSSKLSTTAISIHALREEGDHALRGKVLHIGKISIHALREEGDGTLSVIFNSSAISIHALREEGDRVACCVCMVARLFLSTPSARRATSGASSWQNPPPRFLSTPSARRATAAALLLWAACRDFYPRPPRGGRPPSLVSKSRIKLISIHALREEGDWIFDGLRCTLKRFLSTPSARRATGQFIGLGDKVSISIHALREEGDCPLPRGKSIFARFLSTPSARRATQFFGIGCGLFWNFYPRPPRGGRLAGLPVIFSKWQFLSTPSARRATWQGGCDYDLQLISIHALREEGDSKNRDKSSIFKQIIQHSARI